MKKILLTFVVSMLALVSCNHYMPYYVQEDNVVVIDETTKETMATLQEGDLVMIKAEIRTSKYQTALIGDALGTIDGNKVTNAPINAKGEFDYQEMLTASDSADDLKTIFIVAIALVLFIVLFLFIFKDKTQVVKIFTLIAIPLPFAALSFFIIDYCFTSYYQTWFCSTIFVGFWQSVLNFALFALLVVSFYGIVGYLLPFTMAEICKFKEVEENKEPFDDDIITFSSIAWVMAVIAWMLITWIWDCQGQGVWWALGVSLVILFVKGVIAAGNKFTFIVLFFLHTIVAIAFSFMFYHFALCVVTAVVYLVIAIGVLIVAALFIFLGSGADALGAKYGGEGGSSDSSSEVSGGRYYCKYYKSGNCRNPNGSSGTQCTCGGDYTVSNCLFPGSADGVYRS
ncbi:MAG: hypothetical protein R3Y04_04365 [Rikenellaceae bacterium]